MFTISYGIGVTATRDENHYRSISAVLSDSSLQAELSFDPAQVDARVAGSVLDGSSSVTAGMRIELVKKAGRKSNELLVTDNQLQPIGVSMVITAVLASMMDAAKAPFYAKLEKTAVKVREESKAAQREAVKGTDAFTKYTDAILDRLVEANYVDSVGSLTVPAAIREEIATIAKVADDSLKPLRDALEDAEAKIATWHTSVYADLAMCVTVESQKAVLAKVTASDPLKVWKIEAV